jgi:hypothetical protein
LSMSEGNKAKESTHNSIITQFQRLSNTTYSLFRQR